MNASDREILDRPIQDLVEDVHEHLLQPIDLLHTYGKVAVKAHEKTNCMVEVLLPEAEEWAKAEINLDGPLAGIPVSMKDTCNVKGFDSCLGYSSRTFQPFPKDGALVRLLKQAGAVPFVKTNSPISLLSFESANDVFGRTTNPHNNKYSPGGSSGGEGAILAYGGSRIGIGTDVAGSVRAPAAFSGCYSLRCSTGRWPKAGGSTSMLGQEGVPAVASPMARTLNDLVYFTRSLIQMKPWRLDHTVHPIEWRDNAYDDSKDKKRLRIGVMRDDGVVTPSPACARALNETITSLKLAGHEVFDVHPPSPYEALRLASILLNADGCRTWYAPLRSGEWIDKGAEVFLKYFRLPRPIKYLYYLWVKHVRGDDIWAGLLKDWHEKSAFEQWKLVGQREAYRARWHEWWTEEAGDIDFMLTPVNALPATPHDAMKTASMACGYTFIFNLVSLALMPRRTEGLFGRRRSLRIH